MAKLTILVPSDSAIDMHLSSLSHLYRDVGKRCGSAEFLYDGVIPPLAKISELLAMYHPEEYHIIKSKSGFTFIVCP